MLFVMVGKPHKEPKPNCQVASSEISIIVLLLIIWLAMVSLCNPIGNFPLNDDWSYGRAVKSLLEQGKPEIIDIVTMTLIAQVYWGALFCLPFGFSFTALRMSTLTIGLLGVIATYLMLRELGIRKNVSVLGTLVLATNPIYFSLCNTFMTDVPFISVTMLSLLTWIRSLKKSSNGYALAAVALACVAVLIRQTGFGIPIAFFVSYLLKEGFRPCRLICALLPIIAVASVYSVYMVWLNTTQGIPQFMSEQNRWALSFLASGVANVVSGLGTVALTGIMYIGWFLFPLLIIVFSQRRALLVPGAIALILIAGLLHEGRMMPLKGEPTGDILTSVGIGPLTLWDAFVLRRDVLTPISPVIWLVVTSMGVAGGAVLLYEVSASIASLLRRDDENKPINKPVSALLLVLAIILLSPVVLMRTHGYFDRYFLPILPVLAVYLLHVTDLRETKPIIIGLALVFTFLSGIFSVALTHDYLAWNRARWTALEDMISKEGVPPSDIDGGLEFNFWYNYDPKHWNAWGFVNDEYRVAFSPLDDYEVIGEYAFYRWLPRERADILVLRKAY